MGQYLVIIAIFGISFCFCQGDYEDQVNIGNLSNQL